ncbi:MAG: Arabinose metabolism transcriptional repressor [Lentisphaerae bacterium ADurb.Bin242]|nr:MAG: Arabinose metabolism transcriptional repressor [Lentisphaerae bacterium ADurb.Bin242]
MNCGKSCPAVAEQTRTDEACGRIVRDISENIRNGTLLPGARLHAESKLCQLYKANIYSVRKAIGRLKEEGLLYSIPKFGTYVGDRPEKEPAPASSETAPEPSSFERVVTKVRFSTRSCYPRQKQAWKTIAGHFMEKSLFSEMEPVYAENPENILPPGDVYEYHFSDKNYYARQNELLNIREYFSTAIDTARMRDGFGIPVSYATCVLLYNKDLLKKMGFGLPSYADFSSQLAYFEEVTAAADRDPLLKVPSTSQSVILRLGNHLSDIFRLIQGRKVTLNQFLSDYRDLFRQVTSYWKKYLISYPKQAKANFYDFLAGRSPFIYEMSADYLELLEKNPPFEFGAEIMLAADNTFSRLPVILSVDRNTRHPLECLQLIREMQSDPAQTLFAENGNIPLREELYSLLPYLSRPAPERAGRPLSFSTYEEFYVCVHILAVELWNIILFNKSVEDAMTDCLTLSRAYLNMELDKKSLENQKRWVEFYI